MNSRETGMKNTGFPTITCDSPNYGSQGAQIPFPEAECPGEGMNGSFSRPQNSSLAPRRRRLLVEFTDFRRSSLVFQYNSDADLEVLGFKNSWISSELQRVLYSFFRLFRRQTRREFRWNWAPGIRATRPRCYESFMSLTPIVPRISD